jgi:hypothetical protein
MSQPVQLVSQIVHILPSERPFSCFSRKCRCLDITVCDSWTDKKWNWHLIQTSSSHSGRRFVNATRVWNLCHTSDRRSVQCCSFGEVPDSNHPPVTVFSRCCSMWLLALPKSQRLSSKVIILRLRRNVMQHNNSSRSDTEVLPALTEALEQACIWRRVVIVGWLRFYICSSYYITCPKAFGSFHVHCTYLTYWFELSGERNTFTEEQQVHTELWVEMFMERDDFGNWDWPM